MGVVIVASGCAAKRFQFPTDPGTPLADFAAIYQQVTAACAGARTLTAELALSGHAGAQNLRGRVIAGFARPASMRLEGVAPFGPPAFILVARDDAGTLLLPRDNRVLRNARPEEILGALTGVALSPVDLQAILTGCVVAGGKATGGREHRDGLASIEVDGGAVLYLQRDADRWRIRAAIRPGWDLEYPAWQGDFPQSVRLRSRDQRVDVDLAADISQVDVNIELAPGAFTVDVPERATSLTLDELRNAGPIRAQ